MPYVRFDDNFAEHPKIMPLSDSAFRLHTAAILHVGRRLTDGHIDARDVPRLVRRFRRSSVAELVSAGLWQTANGGYDIHDYLDWNDSHDEVIAAREKARKRRERWRQRQQEDDE